MRDEVFGYGATGKLVVPPGGTLALLIEPVAGECTSVLKYFSGGSLEICQAPVGATSPAASLAVLPGTGYLLSSLESVNAPGPVRYYLVATGATAIAYHLRGLSSGY